MLPISELLLLKNCKYVKQMSFRHDLEINHETPSELVFIFLPVPEPQLDTFVFCKTKSDVGAFQLDDM
jgi:hypothetical protein